MVALTSCSSGRPRSARTDKNTDQVNDMVLSQEDQPWTHSTVREIPRGTDIPKSSVVRIIKSICSCWNALRGDVRAQELTEANCTARMMLSKLLVQKFFQFFVVLFTIFFFFQQW